MFGLGGRSGRPYIVVGEAGERQEREEGERQKRGEQGTRRGCMAKSAGYTDSELTPAAVLYPLLSFRLGRKADQLQWRFLTSCSSGVCPPALRDLNFTGYLKKNHWREKVFTAQTIFAFGTGETISDREKEWASSYNRI